MMNTCVLTFGICVGVTLLLLTCCSETHGLEDLITSDELLHTTDSPEGHFCTRVFTRKKANFTRTCHDCGWWWKHTCCPIKITYSLVSVSHRMCCKGYIGAQCDIALCYPWCKNGGRCVAPGRCDCVSGYTGEVCQTAVCAPECLNGGRCVAPNTCRCPLGYYGDVCQLEDAEHTTFVPEY